jgi:hypothetical protein
LTEKPEEAKNSKEFFFVATRSSSFGCVFPETKVWFDFFDFPTRNRLKFARRRIIEMGPSDCNGLFGKYALRALRVVLSKTKKRVFHVDVL